MAEIQTSRGTILIDDEDWPIASTYKWSAFQSYSKSKRPLTFYAGKQVKRDGKKTTIYLHRLLVGAQPGQQVDHVNKNGLDNRRANLRICNQSQNNANAAWRVGASGFRGVYSAGPRWRAAIQVNGLTYRLGHFDCRFEAAKAYDAAARAHFGHFATLNFPEAI